MNEPSLVVPLDVEMMKTLMRLRDTLGTLEKQLGFMQHPSWRPIAIEGFCAQNGTLASIDTHSPVLMKPAALVVHDPKGFMLRQIWIGKTPQLVQQLNDLPCEQFGYDNPPRLLRMDTVAISQTIRFEVLHVVRTNTVFRATIWGEPYPKPSDEDFQFSETMSGRKST